jgi:ectoine hydroxylase-related dioxygenase (phytanoyl-CoA dioxygenase family)
MSALTNEQVQQFHRDGYLVLPGVFSEAEVKRMRAGADDVLEMILNSSLALNRKSRRLDWRRRPSDGEQVVRKIQPIYDLSLPLSEASVDERLIGPLRQLMGEEPKLMEEKLNYKEPLPEPVEGLSIREMEDNFPIHNDWAYYAQQNYPQTILSSAISFDECTEDAGPLCVWPGSHTQHLEHEKCDNGLQVKPGLIDPEAHKPVLCPAGSVMIFHALLVHVSAPNQSGRPRRLMIYSHYPESANMGFDVRNGPNRLRESPHERAYFRMKKLGLYEDRFKAPVFEGFESDGGVGSLYGAAEPAL